MEDTSNQSSAETFYNLSLFRQLGLLTGLAISVALGVAIVLWAQKGNYNVLYSSLETKDVADIAQALNQMDISYEIDSATGSVLVSSQDIDQAKLKLASMGLPQSNSKGYEMLEKKQSFGTSQFMELSRYRQALEGELAQTIASMNSIKNARVYLAIPKEPVFIRDRRKSSASVFVDLYSGRTLERYQVDAIVNLVASSIPEMRPEDVTVVDQKGNLLTNLDDNDPLGVTAKQLEIKSRVEKDYTNRLRDILSSIVGDNRIRAQVTADLDFTTKEQTSETYSPEPRSVRSSQVVQERQSNFGQDTQGVPGTLNNLPIDQQAQANQPGVVANGNPVILRETNNYEIDRTINHVSHQPWILKRLSVAVAIDDTRTKDTTGKITKTKIPEDQLKMITELVKKTVGVDEQRGDKIEVLNVSFADPEPFDPLPAEPIWTKPWFLQIAKNVAAGVVILFLIFGVLKPVLRTLAIQPAPPKNNINVAAEGFDIPGVTGENQAALASAKLPDLNGAYGSRMESVRNMVRDDPGRVAGVVLDWVGPEDGGQ